MADRYWVNNGGAQIGQGVGTVESAAPAGILQNPANMFDNNVGTSSTTSNAVVWFTIGKDWGLGNGRPIGKARIVTSVYNGFVSGANPNVTLELYGSNTSHGVGGVLLGTNGPFVDVNGTYDIPSDDHTTNYRYVWIEVSHDGGAGGMGANEMYLYDPGDGTWNDAGNWSIVSGGVGGAGVPGAADKAIFDGAEVSDCQLDAAMNITELDMLAAYTGSIDGATDDLNHAISGDVTLLGNRLDMGDGAWTIGGDLVNSLTVFNDDGSSLDMTGAAKSITGTAANYYTDLTISGTITINTAGVFRLYGTTTITGTMTCTVPVNNYSDLKVTLTGTVTGASTLRCYSASDISQQDGTINVATLRLTDDAGGAPTIVAATYASAEVELTGGGGNTFTLSAGVYNFNGNVTFDVPGAGNWSADFAANDPTVNIGGNLTMEETGAGQLTVSMGDGTWTVTGNIDMSDLTTLNPNAGTIALAGAGAGVQTIDFDGLIVGALVMNDVGATKRISAAGFAAASLTLTAGTWDHATNNPSFAISGNIAFGIGAVYNDGTGTLTLAGAGAGTQTIDFNGDTVEAVVINDAGAIKQLTNPVTMASLLVTAGSIDFNTQAMVIVANLTIQAGADVVAVGLAGANMLVGGICDLNGAPGDLLDLQGPAPWVLTVAGPAMAAYVTVTNSNAGAGSEVQATDSVDGGGNINWNFIVPPVPPAGPATTVLGVNRRLKRKTRFAGRGL